jgi:hypothetical protein
MTTHRLVLPSVLALIQGCGGGGGSSNGGGGGGGPGGSTPSAPGAFSANVRFDGATQRFVATWNASQGVERYRVQLKRDNVSDFAPLTGAENLSATILDFSFAAGFTIQWSAAAVRVDACNAVGCTPATDLPLLPHLADALARKQILSVPVDANELRVASSADGNTLVVGASLEDGEDGQQRDKGVVYVFTRTGAVWNEQPTLLRAPNGEGGVTSQVPGDLFGFAVALAADGETLAVGAPLEDGSLTSTVENENDLTPSTSSCVTDRRTHCRPTSRPCRARSIRSARAIISALHSLLQRTARRWWLARHWLRSSRNPISTTVPRTCSRAVVLHGRNAPCLVDPIPMTMPTTTLVGR